MKEKSLEERFDERFKALYLIISEAEIEDVTNEIKSFIRQEIINALDRVVPELEKYFNGEYHRQADPGAYLKEQEVLDKIKELKESL